ncbi:MAG: hypothetical protein Q9221_005868 [Calogaya cf. arnoldii]
MQPLTVKPPAAINNAHPPTPTSPPQNSTTRIRDNQRRSRARRKEYILELEAKVRGYEQRGVTASAEIQTAARKVDAENKALLEEVKRLKDENEKLRRGISTEDGMPQSQENSNNAHDVGQAHDKGAATPSSLSQKRKRVDDHDDNNGKEEQNKRRMQPIATSNSHGGYTNSPDYHHRPVETTTALPPTTFPQHASTSPTSPSSSSPNFSFHIAHPTKSIGTAYPSPPTSSQYKYPHPHYPRLPPPLQQQQPTQPSSYSSTPSDPYSESPHSHLYPPPPPPTTRNENPDADPDTSSCHLAAQIITSMRSDISCEQVRQELGCTEREECKVGNSRLLDVMDRFA